MNIANISHTDSAKVQAVSGPKVAVDVAKLDSLIISFDQSLANQDYVVVRNGDDAVIVFDDGTQVTLLNFFAAATDVKLESPDGQEIAVLEPNNAVADGAPLLRHGSDSSVHELLARISSVDQPSDVGGFHSKNFSPLMLGLGGLIALGAAGGGGGGGAADGFVSGVVTGGPVIAGNSLKVALYDDSGNKLGESSVDASGHYSVHVGQYRGVVLAVVVDSDVEVPDYIDEATSLSKDLNAALLAIGEVSSDAISLNVSAISTLVARIAGASVSNDGTVGSVPTAESYRDALSSVAEAFGLTAEGLLNAPDATNDGAFDGTTASGKLGALLAALSGIDSSNNGNSQLTIDDLVADLRDDGRLSDLSQQKLVEGAAAASWTAPEDASSTLVSVISDLLTKADESRSETTLSINTIAGDSTIDAEEKLLGFTLSGKASPSTTVTIQLAPGRSYTVDVDANGDWTKVVGSEDISAMGSDGVKFVSVSSSIDSSFVKRLVYLNAVDDAPTGLIEAPSPGETGVVRAIAENSVLASDRPVARYIVVDDGIGENTFTLEGADKDYFTINPADGVLSLKSGTALNHEEKDSYTVTVKATGGANSSSESKEFTLYVSDVNEAPTSNTTPISQQTAVKGQSGWTIGMASHFVDPDQGDTLTYSVSNGTLPAGLSIDATTGVISGTPTAAAASANITVTATDGGGLSTSKSFVLQVVEAPVAQSFSVHDGSGDGTKGKSGDTLTFDVVFSEAVTVTGAPEITFTINGVPVQATYVGGSGTGTLSFSAVAPAGDGTSVTLTSVNLNGGTVTGSLSGQGWITTTTGPTANYTLDNTSPTVTASYSVGENSSSDTNLKNVTLAAADANGPVTWSGLSGADASEFTLVGNTLTFKGVTDFETKPSYSVNVTATDAAGNTSAQTIAVNLVNVNEAPTVANVIADQTFVVGGTVDSFQVPINTFTDVDAGTSLTYTATLADGNALPSWLSFDTSTRTFSGNPPEGGTTNVRVTASDGQLTVSDTFAIVAVAAPALATTLSSAVTNFDVRSSIVFSVGESVIANTGGTITLTDSGGVGFRGESTVRTQVINVDDTSQVQIVGSGANTRIIVTPTFDLDLSATYNLSVSTGAFRGGASGLDSGAFAAIAFSTVTPGLLSGGGGAAVMAKRMNVATGALEDSAKWLDVTNPSDDDPTGDVVSLFDAGTADFVFAVSDTDPSAADLNISAETFIRFNSFGANDLLYIDNREHQLSAQIEAINANFFAGGEGTASSPFEAVVGATGTSGSAKFQIAVDSTVGLPAGVGSSSDSLLQTILANNWSNTGMVITG
jgi:Putative Ig domain